MLEALDDLLGTVSRFDLITPTFNGLQNILRGPRYTFRVPHRAGYGIFTIEKMLRKAGCNPVWGKEIFGGVMLINVKAEHAHRGYWALHREGVPMLNTVPRQKRR